MPSAAVSGMASSATSSVVISEFHADPARNQPCSPCEMRNAVRKYSSVGVLSVPTALTKPPNRMTP